MDKIIVSDAYAKLTEEIQRLKQILAALTEERNDLLYHVCPELAARYARQIGDYMNRINYQKIMILEMKRRIEIARSALNREKTVSQKSVDEQVRKEYQKFHDKADEEFRRSEQAKQSQSDREKRQRQYEQQWQQQYGRQYKSGKGAEASNEDGASAGSNRADDGFNNAHGSGQTNTDSDTGTGAKAPADTELPNAKEMFRKIVKKLHPDMNPDITEREKELFNKAVKSYQNGDIATLQEIYDEVFCAGEAEADGKELTLEELTEIKHKLETRIAQLQAEIKEIKADFPYREKDLLDNQERLDKLRREMEEIIRQNEETVRHLNEMLSEINKEMNKQPRRRRKSECPGA